MISDVLSDAAVHIRRYLREFPSTYREDVPIIHAVLAAMDALRLVLDSSPTPTPPTARLLDSLRALLTAIPHGELTAVQMRYLAHVAG